MRIFFFRYQMGRRGRRPLQGQNISTAPCRGEYHSPAWFSVMFSQFSGRPRTVAPTKDMEYPPHPVGGGVPDAPLITETLALRRTEKPQRYSLQVLPKGGCVDLVVATVRCHLATPHILSLSPRELMRKDSSENTLFS